MVELLLRELRAINNVGQEWHRWMGPEHQHHLEHRSYRQSPQPGVGDARRRTQELFIATSTVLCYRRCYAEARRLLTADLRYDIVLSPAVCKAWAREALVLVQLARGELEGAVSDMLSSQDWAQSYTLSLYAQRVLEQHRRHDLAQRVADHTAELHQMHAQERQLKAWEREIDAGCNLHGLISAIPAWKGTGDDQAMAAIGSVVQHLTRGQTREALQLMVHPPPYDTSQPLKVVPYPLAAYADNLFTHHLLPSLGLHCYSCNGAQQQQRLARELRSVWCDAHAAGAQPDEHTQDFVQDISCYLTCLALHSDVSGLAGRAEGTQQQALAADISDSPLGQHYGAGPAMPLACHAVKHTLALMGFGQVVAAAPAPGVPPALVLLPESAELLLQGLARQGLMQRSPCPAAYTVGDAVTALASQSPMPDARFRLRLVGDMEAAVLALATSQQQSHAELAVSLARLRFVLAGDACADGAKRAEHIKALTGTSIVHAAALSLHGRPQQAAELVAALQEFFAPPMAMAGAA